MQLLNAKRRRPTAEDDTLFQAIERGDQGRVKELVALARSVNRRNVVGQTPLLAALGSREVNIASVLLDAGADPNLSRRAGWTPLMSAALNGFSDILLELIDRGADVNALTATGQTPLVVATLYGNDECARLLLERKADPDPKVEFFGYSPLIFASGNCDEETVKLLLDKGADPNRETVDHMTALRLAEQRGRQEIVALLKSHGATK